MKMTRPAHCISVRGDGDEVGVSFNRLPLSFETAIEISLLKGLLYFQSVDNNSL